MENQYNQFNQYNAPVYQGCTINNNFYGQEQKVETAEEKQKPVNNEDFFCRITQHAIDSGHAQEVEDALRSAAVSAPKLVKAIKTNEALGYLDTQNLTSQALYDMLNEHFGLKFGVRNFTIARNR